MKVRWIHTADVHLGYHQYGQLERAQDFVRAFAHVCEYAIKTSPGFMLIAGDLFHKRNVDARTMLQAYELLYRLKASGVPVLCVEGNHERAFYNAGWSWLDFLSGAGLMYLLSPTVTEDGSRMEPWDDEQRLGGYVDIGPVRVFGIKYYGSSAPAVLKQVSEQLSRMNERRFNVMMLHEGMEGQLPRVTGGLSSTQLEMLRPYSQYLALGHIHKQYDFGDWAYNPGSLETCSSEECEWDRGFYEIEADTDSGQLLKVDLHHVPRRPFRRFFVGVERYPTPERLLDGVLTQVDQGMKRRNGKPPVLEVTLRGTLQFSDGVLNVRDMETRLDSEFDPLIARVRDSTMPAGYDSRFVMSEDGQIDRRALELQVLNDLVSRDARYSAAASEWAETFRSVKDMALEHLPPGEIFGTLEQGMERADKVAREGGNA